MMTHPRFRERLEAIGFGVFIPIFFVASGLDFDLPALFTSAATVVLVPVFLAALLVVRRAPALPYRPLLGGRRAAAGLLQATSLSFIVVAARIGMELGVIGAATSAALVAAGLLSVLIFPLGAPTLLGRGGSVAARPEGTVPA